MNNEQARELFSLVADDPAPLPGFSTDSIVEGGRRGARRQRIAAVGAATAGVAAVAVAVAAVPGFTASGRTAVEPGSSTRTSATTPATADPVCAADVAAEFPAPPAGHPDFSAATRRNALELCPALRAIDAILDPTAKHLIEADSSGRAVKPEFVVGWLSGSKGYVGATASLCYNDHGLASTQNQAQCADLPEVAIQVTFSVAGAADPAPVSGDMTLANRAAGVGSGSAPWVVQKTSKLADGSTVTISEVQNGDRVSMKARRVLKSGAALTIVAWDGYDSTSATEVPGSVYNPFPFTVDQMVAAVSVDGIVVSEGDLAAAGAPASPGHATASQSAHP